MEIDVGAVFGAVVALMVALAGSISAGYKMVDYFRKRTERADSERTEFSKLQGQVTLLAEQLDRQMEKRRDFEQRISDFEVALEDEKRRGDRLRVDLDQAQARIHELEVDKAIVQSANETLERFVTMFTNSFGRVIEAALAPGDVVKLVESDGAG